MAVRLNPSLEIASTQWCSTSGSLTSNSMAVCGMRLHGAIRVSRDCLALSWPPKFGGSQGVYAATYDIPQNCPITSCSVATLENPNAPAAALIFPNWLASADTVLPRQFACPGTPA